MENRNVKFVLLLLQHINFHLEFARKTGEIKLKTLN